MGWDFICQLALSVRRSGRLGNYQLDVHAPGIYCAIVVHFLAQGHKNQNKAWTLLGLLRLTRQYMATDVRDKVFALIGVVTDLDSIGLKVDYKLSTEDVYLSVAIHNLEKLRDLELLSNAGVSAAPTNDKLPSWVPNWSHNHDRRSILAVGSNVRFHAAGDSQPVLSISEDKTVLTIRGIVIDTISQLNTTYVTMEKLDNDPTKENNQKRVRLEEKKGLDCCETLAQAAHKFPENHTREEALWRTLCCDRLPTIPHTRAPEEFGIGYKLLRILNRATTAEGEYDMNKIDLDWVRANMVHSTALSNAMLKFTVGRRLCVTTGGYLGRVPFGSEAGDTICILFGGCVPFVLRECDEGTFKFIGECYIHGVMEGEAMENTDIETVTRDFKIR